MDFVTPRLCFALAGLWWFGFSHVTFKRLPKGKKVILNDKTTYQKGIIELKKVWKYAKDVDTHTVETHIYRLRKKIKDKFNDENFIYGKYNGLDLVKLTGYVARKNHPIPAPVYVIVGKYINVPEHLYGPIKYASPTINIEHLFVPKDVNEKYDLVMLNHVFEHLTNLEKHVHHLYDITKKYLFIEVLY